MPYINNILGLIFSNMHDKTIEDLTKVRTMGSVMFGGRYRLIDFALSNMVNSGISEVGVITKSNFQSLIDHLGSGREWDLARKKGGLHILPPYGNTASGIYKGRLDALCGIFSFIKYSTAEYVVMSDCDIVTNMNFRPVIEAHIAKGADITVVTNKAVYTEAQTGAGTVLSVDDDSRVYDTLINPNLSGLCNISLNMYVVKRTFLLELLQQAKAKNHYSFEQDIIQAKAKELKIYAYNYDNYFSRIDSLYSYFNANMNLLNNSNRAKLFLSDSPIYTKVRDNAPCKYGIDSSVKNSLVADGCIIEGNVENSIVFRGVKIAKGAVVKNSIIMQDTVIGEKAEIRFTITDKNVTIRENKTLTGELSYPILVNKGANV